MSSEIATLTNSDLLAMVIVIFLGIVVILFKGLGLWHSARQSQKWWFIAILILNTMGILPLIYLFFFRSNREKLDIFGRKRKRKKKR